jgi:type IV fimbrial biogenesis protein FimT
MFQLIHMKPARAQAGVTFVELAIGLAIVAIVMAVGMPVMSNWVVTNKAASAAEFYADGFAMARREAVARNASARIVLAPNVTNGQMDWRVDVCYPAADVRCTDASGNWSSTSTPASNDPLGATAGYKSVFRDAGALPQSDVLLPSIEPAGASEIYFTALGWVDTTIENRLTRIRLDPATRYANEIPVAAVAVALAGMATKCNPTLSAPDSRACPP